eukprot:scaffold8315_cov23-Tisochrysis_lutea.AAC.1
MHHHDITYKDGSLAAREGALQALGHCVSSYSQHYNASFLPLPPAALAPPPPAKASRGQKPSLP